MQSIATYHFPQVILEGGKKWLFNPILKKRLANRPEERVRLRWVEYLLLQSDWQKSRIGFETPVKLRQETNSLRADLILFSDQLKPQVLVECKSEKISLTSKVAEQAARYNTTVDAEKLVLTNGVKDFWFSQQEQSLSGQPGIINEIKDLDTVRSDPDYWTKRGFCSPQSDRVILVWLSRILQKFFDQKRTWATQYLPFQESVFDLPMDNYYRVVVPEDGTKLALSFIGGKNTKNYLVGVLNQKGKNSGIVLLILDDLISGRESKVTVLKDGERVQKSIQPDQIEKIEEIEKLPGFIMNFFD